MNHPGYLNGSKSIFRFIVFAEPRVYLARSLEDRPRKRLTAWSLHGYCGVSLLGEDPHAIPILR